jgi:hypothetical protein
VVAVLELPALLAIEVDRHPVGGRILPVEAHVHVGRGVGGGNRASLAVSGDLEQLPVGPAPHALDDVVPVGDEVGDRHLVSGGLLLDAGVAIEADAEPAVAEHPVLGELGERFCVDLAPLAGALVACLADPALDVEAGHLERHPEQLLLAVDERQGRAARHQLGAGAEPLHGDRHRRVDLRVGLLVDDERARQLGLAGHDRVPVVVALLTVGGDHHLDLVDAGASWRL